MAPENTAFSFKTPVEGETLFLPALDHFLILYPGSYAQGSRSTYDIPVGLKRPHEGNNRGRRTLPGAAATDFFQRKVTPP